MKKIMTTKKNNETLVERHHILNTPFVGVKIDDDTYIITMGQYRMANRTFKNMTEVNSYIKTNFWDLIGVFTSIISQNIYNLLNNQKINSNE